jgi:hypothetical protein
MLGVIALLALFSAGLVLISLTGRSRPISWENWDRLQVGMSKAEVELILGEGEIKLAATTGLDEFISYKWIDGPSWIQVTFVNDKVGFTDADFYSDSQRFRWKCNGFLEKLGLDSWFPCEP